MTDPVASPAPARRRIAIVGSGISGLVSAYLLHCDHEITVYEADEYIGGHTNTVPVERGGHIWNVDTGFIVYNEANYPNFTKLLHRLDVATHPSTMSFSVRCATSGLEYNGTDLNGLFAQRRNLASPTHYGMLMDIARFYREAPELLATPDDPTSMGEYLEKNRYRRRFVDQHIIPMGAAIWSADPESMLEFPAAHFVRFFHHHGFLSLAGRPQWRVITDGSQEYVRKLTAAFRDRIRLRTPVRSIRRDADAVCVTTHNSSEFFDDVILAVHSDQALQLLSDPSPDEKSILGAIPYQRNETVLHTDTSMLPKRRRAWASWNYYLPKFSPGRATVTYNMNILQGLESDTTFCVSLNRNQDIHPDHIVRELVYHHPVYTNRTMAAQKRHAEISGVDHTHYCGAYWGYGFHEDGVRSALRVTAPFGKTL